MTGAKRAGNASKSGGQRPPKTDAFPLPHTFRRLFAEESSHTNNVASTGGHKNSQAAFEPELADLDAPGPKQQGDWRNVEEKEGEEGEEW
jgi:hypothetical protein